MKKSFSIKNIACCCRSSSCCSGGGGSSSCCCSGSGGCGFTQICLKNSFFVKVRLATCRYFQVPVLLNFFPQYD